MSCRLKVGQKLLTGGKHGRDVPELPLTGEHNCQVVTVSQNQTAVQKEEHGTYGDISAAHGLSSVCVMRRSSAAHGDGSHLLDMV